MLNIKLLKLQNHARTQKSTLLRHFVFKSLLFDYQKQNEKKKRNKIFLAPLFPHALLPSKATHMDHTWHYLSPTCCSPKCPTKTRTSFLKSLSYVVSMFKKSADTWQLYRTRVNIHNSHCQLAICRINM